MQGTIGEVRIFAGTFAPRTWAFCEGQLLPIAQNTALFSIIGTIYGGDGRTTFALPDLRGRVPVGVGSGPGLSPYVVGQKGGAEHITLNITQIPSHNHLLEANSGTANKQDPGGHILATEAAGATAIYSDQNPNILMNALAIGNTGGGQSHENRQPYLAMHYIICLSGIFPSRN